MKRLFVVLAFVAVVSCEHGSAVRGAGLPPNDIEIGFIEQTGRYEGTRPAYRVRVAFHHSHEGWCAHPHEFSSDAARADAWRALNKQRAWYVVFCGEKLGELVSKATLQDWGLAHVGVQILASGQTVPHPEEPSYEFAGWPGGPVRRPLVLVTTPYFKDRAHWRKVDAPEAVPASVFAAFQSAPIELWPAPDWPSKELPEYGIHDMRVFQCWRSRSGKRVIGIRFNEGVQIDNGYDYPATQVYWFATAKDGGFRYLGADMFLLDFGDFDNDGKSEVIFKVTRYNRDGYVLFWNDFGESVSFIWGYH